MAEQQLVQENVCHNNVIIIQAAAVQAAHAHQVHAALVLARAAEEQHVPTANLIHAAPTRVVALVVEHAHQDIVVLGHVVQQEISVQIHAKQTHVILIKAALVVVVLVLLVIVVLALALVEVEQLKHAQLRPQQQVKSLLQAATVWQAFTS